MLISIVVAATVAGGPGATDAESWDPTLSELEQYKNLFEGGVATGVGLANRWKK